jgi:polyketide synthase PksM
MDSREILRALQSRKISPEEAKKELAKLEVLSEQSLHINTRKQERYTQEGIAIIGMSGQFPKAKNLVEFWDNLAQGIDCISEIPATRWSIDEYYDKDTKAPGKTYCKWMGLLEDADRFDPLFFNISPAEAEFMDPQQRVFLESSWSCFEDSGISPSALYGSRCGSFCWLWD